MALNNTMDENVRERIRNPQADRVLHFYIVFVKGIEQISQSRLV